MEDLQNIVPMIGITIGFTLLVGLWVGIALWLFADANRYGLIGWLWAFIGIATGPFGLIVYLIVRRILHPADRTLLALPQEDPLPLPALIEMPAEPEPPVEPQPQLVTPAPPAEIHPLELPVADVQPRRKIVARVRRAPDESQHN